jgi:hypothetical protein
MSCTFGLDPQVESTAVVSFLEEAGSRMRKLWLTYSSQTTAILGALLVGWGWSGKGLSGDQPRPLT